MIWYRNVSHTELAKFKRSQNWVKVIGEYLTFPGGGNQFKRGALLYIDFILQFIVLGAGFHGTLKAGNFFSS